jgi:hypothetical protein
MAAVTAITFVGNVHSNDSGIHLIDTIEFSEGSRPSFEFLEKKGRRTRERLILIPTIENTLDDLLFLISYHLVEHPEIVSAVKKIHGKIISGGRVEMYSDFTEAQRKSLYEKIMSLQDLPKVAICLFESSHLVETIHHLQEYILECEVCRSTFRRSYSRWNNTWESIGSLT